MAARGSWMGKRKAPSCPEASGKPQPSQLDFPHQSPDSSCSSAGSLPALGGEGSALGGDVAEHRVTRSEGACPPGPL